MQSTSATIFRPSECGIPTSFSGPENPNSQTNHIMKKPTRSGIHAHNIETGEEIWAFPTPKHVGTSPVIHNNAVFFGTDNGVFYAIH